MSESRKRSWSEVAEDESKAAFDARAEILRLRELIGELRQELLERLRDDGGCDHSVGICCCGTVDLLKRAAAAIDMKRCRVCSCTEDLACFGGCFWAPTGEDEKPICSECANTRGDDADPS